MIRKLTSLQACRDFIDALNCDPVFSDPMLSTSEQIEVNLFNAVRKPNDHVLGVYRDSGALIGLFVFLILPEERYIEMIVGLSRDAEAYAEIADWLQNHYPGFQADFVFNPANILLRALLERKGAVFDAEQEKMVFSGPPPSVDDAGIELLSERYMPQYLAMHSTGVYWTGEKVAAAPERFRVLLAVEDGTVVGYLDVTHCYEENEPYSLQVLAAHRRRGWGRKLLAKALELNRPKGMMLLVDVGDAPTIRLYESAGFVKVEGQNSLTATWQIP
jgi:ribosomal protein S18 acetylase RimI-like enzyme